MMTTSTRIYPGKVVPIKAGTLVKREGRFTKRQQTAYVTVRKTEPARGGKTRVYWKSHGVLASALI